MELTAEDLFEAREDLRAALALIPPLKLLRFDANIVPEKDIAVITRPTLSNVRFLIRIVVQYEGSIRFPFFVTDTGIPYTIWALSSYLTHPIRVAARNWVHATRAKKVRAVAKARMALIKEDLMAAAWHPDRVAKMIAAGGFECLDD